MADTDDSAENQVQAADADASEERTLNPETMADDPSMIGRVLGGKYVILEKLGQGGMGVVYKAEQTYVDRIVAVKILHSHLTANKTFLKRFHHEARINSRISHPNAVMLYDFGIEDGMPYLVLEYVQGTTLKEVLAREGALSIPRINNILKQVGSALVAAHELDIVHRDLKPDNIMLTKGPNGEEDIRVLDFGIAKALHQTGDQHNTMVTQAGMLMGTPAYISPELAMERELDARSDIYSLGVILFEMLTGEIPFKSNSPLETYIQHIRNEPPQVRELKPDLNIPKSVSFVVAKALEKEPANRFQFVGEMIRAFDYAARTRETAAAKPMPKLEPTLPHDKLPDSKPRVNKALWGSIGLTGAVLAALFLIPQFLEHRNSVNDAESQAAVDAESPKDSGEKAETPPADKSEVAPEPAVETAALAPAHEPSARALAPNDTVDLNEPTAETAETAQADSKTEAQPSVNAATEPVTEPVTEPATEPAAEPGVNSDLAATEQPAVTEPVAAANEIVPSIAQDLPVESKPAPDEIVVAKNDTQPAVEPRVDAAQPQDSVPGETDEITAKLLTPEPPTGKPLSPQKAKAEADKLAAEGDKLLDKKDYLAAGLQLKKSLALQENNLGARLSFGSVLLRLGKPDKAIIEFEKALTIDPQYAPTHYSLASAYALSSQPEKALESLETAAKLFPGVSKWLADDADFASLKDDPRYQAIANKK